MTDAVAAPVARTENAHVRGGLAAAALATPVALLASLPGLVFLAGFDHLAYGLGLLAGVVLAGLLTAPHVAQAGAASLPEALRKRFGIFAAAAGSTVIVLVVLPLLAAELALIGIISEAGLGIPYLAAILVAVTLSGAVALRASEHAFGWMAIAAFALFAATLLVPLLLISARTGVLVPHFAYGEALSAIAAMEERLVEGGLVDFDTFSMHAAPFLRLSGLDLAAVIVSLALGIAVLPPVVSALAADGRRPAVVRITGAWTALFVMLLLVTVPVLATYAKHEIYGAMTSETPLAALPSWLEAPLRAGVARIHGTSVYLLSAVAEAVRAGHSDAVAVSAYLTTDATAAAQWTTLDEAMREAVLGAARTLANDTSAPAAWNVYLTTVLPAAATAAGNDAAMLTQAALVLEPAGLILALPGLAGIPTWGAGLLLSGVLALALVMAAALLRTFTPAGSRLPRAPRTHPGWRALAPVLAIAAVAAGAATVRSPDLVTIVVAALSLAAAGLFPVMALGLAWKRATAAGAVAAILIGGGVTLYYDVGIQVFPAAFYRTWAPLSNAGEFAAEEFTTLEAEARDAEDAEARSAAETSLEELARGSAARRGLANWFGIDSASGAVFGVPLGILTLVLVSLVTRRRRQP